MSTSTAPNIVVLSGDLVPFIGAAKTSMTLSRIVDVKLTTHTESQREVGAVTLEVLEVFAGGALLTGSRLEVPMHRLADAVLRRRNAFDYWNTITLAPGTLWLLAARQGTALNQVTALAVMEVPAASAPEVIALRHCYVIERLGKGDERKRQLLEVALAGSEPLVRSYALDLLGRRALYKRVDGVHLIAQAIDASTVPADDKLELGTYLTHEYFFDGERNEDGTNQTVVTSLAAALVRESVAERRLEWANLLASCILGELSPKASEDKARRLALVRGVRDPPPSKVIEALRSLLPHTADDHGDVIRELEAAWRAAL
jgi:hypothetical protein